MTSFEGDLEEQLKEAGNELINPPSSIDELLNLLDKVENLLANVEQAPSESMKDALLPSMKALITVELLRHSEMDVKVSVASCITEITRITAPDAPYNDEQMKEIFQLTVAAFENLSHASTRCYTKTISILETVARVRSCLVMLDLECDTLIVEMFQNFLKRTRSNHPLSIFSAMETIMTMVIEESEEISLDLLIPLLSSVKKENQTDSPIAWQLGEKVITNCAVKLKHYLKETVQSMGIALDDYSQIVTSICQSGPNLLEHEQVNGYREHSAHENKLGKQPGSSEPPQVIKGLAPDTVCCTKIGQSVDSNLKSMMSNFAKNDNNFKKEKISKSLQRLLTRHSKSISARSNAEPGSVDSKKTTKSEIQRVSLPKKRGRKPNFVMNPEEGYDHILISTGRKTTNVHRRKSHDGGVDDSPSENLDPGKVTSSLEDVTELSDFQPKINKIVIAAAPFTDHSLPDANQPKRDRPKKKGNTVNQDANPNSLSRSKGRFLNSRVGEKAPQSADLSLKKESEVLHNSNTKPQGHTRKIRIATKTKEETTLALGYVVSEKEVAVPYVPEEKLVSRPSAMNSRSSIRMFIKKRKRDNATYEKDNTEASNRKTISKSASKSTNRDASCLEETSKTKLRRKHTATKEKSSKKSDLGERLVGSSIKVWWPLDKMFYEGVVNFYDPVKKKHQVLYADGDEEILNLKKERWELVGDNVLRGGQGTDLPELYASCDLSLIYIYISGLCILSRLEKSKGKVKSQSAKRQKVDASSKRIQASDGIFKVVKPTKSVDDPSKADDGHKKFTGKLRIEKLKAGTRLKQNMPKTITLPKGFL
ncbi:uncharacterized protein LOC121262297 isoform X2 [Juglans microcarpa x Juglans regia]|uniref:uncharacterized protein LOC121262297 isoform X2 n=1 Tax=Juglans microcarpa x Juglans regia TaxID=2249226 RepID=UPI001B7E0844|nr:uncharacterized protein LOC121262297 isoform X2 [Juglans microcarpa x Juglans regia]